jgi:hypothetical protein
LRRGGCPYLEVVGGQVGEAAAVEDRARLGHDDRVVALFETGAGDTTESVYSHVQFHHRSRG